jgi:CheY-like chemotaxis protein
LPPSLGPRTILVIDDSHAVLAVTRSTLEAAGYRVITRTRAEGCVALILQEKPDAVLVDPNASAGSAETVVRLFGRAQPHSETLVLFHSAHSEETMRTQALTLGAHGYVRKSDDAFDLIQQMDRCLKHPVQTSHSRLKAGAPSDVSDDTSPGRAAAVRTHSVPTETRSAASAATVPATRRSSGSLQLDLPVVLFIDDDMGTLSGFRREVQSEPYAVEFALSGTRAIQRILAPVPPKVVVSDLMMPGASGADVFEKVVSMDPSWQDRFVFVTGASVLSDFSGFLASFKGTVLQKPVEGAVLRGAIRRLMGIAEDGRIRQVP